MTMMSACDVYCEALVAIERHLQKSNDRKPHDRLRLAILEQALDHARADLLRCWMKEKADDAASS